MPARKRAPITNNKAAEDWIASGESPRGQQFGILQVVPIEQIVVPESRTRPLNSDHVQELLDSIAAVGLAQPIAVDVKHCLIAGGHRIAAIQRLKSEQPKIYKQQFPDGVPCRVFDFDALAEPERAEAIEIVENEKRRDYTPAEVKAIAQKYTEQGYAYSGGRPKAGEKPLIPALETYFRLSRATIKRYLSVPDKSGHEKSSSHEPLSPKARKIKRFIDSAQQLREFLAAEKAKGTRSVDNVLGVLEGMLKAEGDEADF